MWLTELFLLLRVTDISAAVIAWPDPEVQRLKKKNVLPPLVCFENPRFFMLGRNNYDIIVRCKYITHRLHWCFFFNPSINQQNHKTITSHLTKTSSQKYIPLLYQHNSCWWKTVVSETFFLLTVNRGKKKLWFWNKATSLIYKDLVEKA